MNKDLPDWAVRSDHGILAETRAKAFLLQRFWVLERSIDLHGADLIFQRKATTKNILDGDSPQFGVAQVKYFGGPSTHHFVRKEYVLDESEKARPTFYLICDTGGEDGAQLHVISGPDVPNVFSQVEREGHLGFAITFASLTLSNRFQVTSAKNVLDRIDAEIRFTEAAKTQSLVRWILSARPPDFGLIRPMFREPIDNWWGDDLSTGFTKVKKAAWRGMQELEEIHALLGQVATESDPTVAEELVEQIAYSCRSSHGWSVSIPDEVCDHDLFTVCRRHKRIVEQLTADGLLDAFHALRAGIRTKVVEHLERHQITRDTVHRFEVEYNPETLALVSIRSDFPDLASVQPSSDARTLEAFEQFAPGRIVFRWLPGRYASMADEEGQVLSSYLRNHNHYFYYECLDRVFTMKYGE